VNSDIGNSSSSPLLIFGPQFIATHATITPRGDDEQDPCSRLPAAREAARVLFCMHACRVRSIQRCSDGKAQAGVGRLMMFALCVSLGKGRYVRIGACMHAAGVLCTCGVPVLGRCKSTRFQTFDGDGGGAMPRGKHVG
jgi:hypothetical protein